MNAPRSRGVFLHHRTDIRPKNWNYEQSKLQMLQLGRAAAEDWKNSVFVEGYTARYWMASEFSGTTCTCRAQQTESANSDDEQHDVTLPVLGSVRNQQDGPMRFSVTGSDNNVFAADELDAAQDETPISEFVYNDELDANGLQKWVGNDFEDGPDCAICYRLGSQPGYHRANGMRVVLTSLNISGAAASNVENEHKPHQIRVEEDGWVRYTLEVPKYWNRAFARVFLNHEEYDTLGIWTSEALTELVTHDWLYERRGQVVSVYVNQELFTHAVFEFELPADPIRISLPQLSRLRQYDRFINIPSVTVIIDNTVPLSQVKDVIFCPQLNLLLKVTEVKPLRLLDNYQIGWELQARIVQPTEGTNSISISEAFAVTEQIQTYFLVDEDNYQLVDDDDTNLIDG